MLWLLLGDYRTGKTLRLSVEAFSEEYNERVILANFELKHPNARYIKDPTELENLSNVLVLLDEMQNWFNSHNTYSLDNEFFTDFIHDCDKDGVDVFGTSHRFMSNEIDFREGCHRLIKCERIGYQDPRIPRLQDTRDFKYTVFSMTSGAILYRDILKYNIAKNYFDTYDTKERIKRFNSKTRELLMLWKHNPSKALKKSEKIVDILFPIFNNGVKLSYANIEIELGKLDYGENDKLTRKFFSLLQKRLR